MEIGLLVSGNLGFKVFSDLMDNYVIKFVLTDKGSKSVISLCKKKQIAYYTGNPRTGRGYAAIAYLGCDVLLSVNYLFIIENDLICLPKKIAINFHGSLLPKYRGRTPHVWAIINNEVETGITAHVLDEGCDTGSVIEQRKIKIESTDTGASILEKFNSIYPAFVRDVLQNIQSGSYSLIEQNSIVATYFGKRTPGDGRINWDWQKERLNNWIRAQAKPYPGAFTFYENEKVIIHKIEFSDFGFNFSVPNGQILNIEDSKPIVKTENGCIKLIDFDCNKKLELHKILE